MKKVSPSVTAIFAAVLFLLGGFLLCYNYIQEKKLYAFSYMNTLFASTQTVDITSVESESDSQNVVEQHQEKKEPINSYIGTLTISKIGFQRGFLNKYAAGNNIEENITVLKESDYPDIAGGNMIIAAHSGPTANSFFNNLYQLENGDTAVITYQGNTYTYQLVRSYKVSKTGTVKINRDREKTTLTLITCTNNDNKTQTVYIFERS